MTLDDYRRLIDTWCLKEKLAAEKKLSDYAGGDDVLGLLKEVAARRKVSVWEVFEDWRQRHLLPIEWILHGVSLKSPILSEKDRQILQWRAADELGYVFLLFALIEEANQSREGSLDTVSLASRTDHRV